jgi:ABC-type Na+ efflux pump permease subunit
LRREVKAAGQVRGLFAFRTMMALAIGGCAAAVGLVMFGPSTDSAISPGVYEPRALRVYSAIVLAVAIGIQATFVPLWAAMAAGAGIAEEREKDTLPLLLLTRLTRLELVATKMAGRLAPSFLLMLTGLPLILGGARVVDLSPLLAVEILAVVTSTLIMAGSLGSFASSRRDRTATAHHEALAWSMFWLVVLPLASLMPARSGTLWGDLLVELRRLAGWLAPSSPVSLLTDRSWLSGQPDVAGALSGRLLTMLAMQAAVIALALAGSVAGLRLREPHPTSWDPHRGYRPPVGDDPIYWREYELPRRGARLPAVVIYARYLLILLRAIVMMALQAVFVAVAMAVPIGLVIGAGWFGYFAFRQSWGLAPAPVGAPDARDHLNWFIRAVTFMLGSIPMMNAASTVAAGIALERDKKTWEPLLTTPLTGPEILSSKMRAAARGAVAAGRWLIPVWLLGVICGAVHPLGAVAAAAAAVLVTRLGLALGVREAIKPGATTRSANSAAASWSLALWLVGALTVVAPLSSTRDLENLKVWDARLPWLASVGLVAAAVAMAALARSLTRRCFERFDQWVGRPHRATTTGAPRRQSPSAVGAPIDPCARASPPHRPVDPAVVGCESRPAPSGSTSR